MTATFSSTLRRLVRVDMARRPRSLRLTAELAGLSHTALYRWLRGGEMRTGGVDLLVDYLGTARVAAAMAGEP